MYCTPLSFSIVHKWFQEESRFNYLCLFVSSYDTNDIDIVKDIYSHKMQIDRITGSDICFLFFTSSPIKLDKRNESFMLYQVNEFHQNQDLNEVTLNDLRCGMGLETSIEVSEDVCKEFNIFRADLPAFIFVEKGKYHSPLVYSVKTYEDFDFLLKPINAVNSFISDLNNLDFLLNKVERLLNIRKELDNLSIPTVESSLKSELLEYINILRVKGAKENLIDQIRQNPMKYRKLTFTTLPYLTSDREVSKKIKKLKRVVKGAFENRTMHKSKLEAAFERNVKKYKVPSTYGEICELKQNLLTKKIKSKERFTEELLRCINLDSEIVKSMMLEIEETRKISPKSLKSILEHISLFHQKNIQFYKVFIAGSKKLHEQRKLLRAALMEMQVLWNTGFQAKTFEDFARSLVDKSDGRQGDYNEYIINEADIVAFVFDGSVGGISMKEFDIAFESLKNNGGSRPEIFVYCRDEYDINYVETLSEIGRLKEKMNDIKQYYIEYVDNNDLFLKFKNDINRYLIERRSASDTVGF